MTIYKTVQIGYIDGIKEYKIPIEKTKRKKLVWNEWDIENLKRLTLLGFSTKEIQSELIDYRSLVSIRNKQYELKLKGKS